MAVVAMMVMVTQWVANCTADNGGDNDGDDDRLKC